MAAATCRVSEVAQAASAAAAGLVRARLRICAVASATARVRCSQSALRCSAVRFSCARPGLACCGVHRCCSLGQLRSAASFPPPYQTRVAVFGGVAGERDSVPGDLAGVLCAEPFSDQEVGLVQAMEELALAACCRGSGGDLPSQRDPGCFVQATAGCFLVLGTGRAAGGGAVGRCGRAQPVALLGGDAGGADVVPFPGQAGLTAVLAGQHGNQVDVILAVPDGDPADGLVLLPVGGQAGAVHHVVCDDGPFVVGQHPVVGSGAHRAVPYRPGAGPRAECGLRLQEQPGQLGEVAFAVRS